MSKPTVDQVRVLCFAILSARSSPCQVYDLQWARRLGDLAIAFEGVRDITLAVNVCLSDPLLLEHVFLLHVVSSW